MSSSPHETDRLKDEIAATRKYWDDRARTAGSDSDRINMSARSQQMRFESFLQFHDPSGCTLLDIGCGVGDLLGYLRQRGIQCHYTGFDISDEMVKRCRERFPDAEFISGDFLEWQTTRQFDYTIAMSIHNNVRGPHIPELMRRTTVRQFELCTRAA